MRLRKSPALATTRAVINLVMLAIGRCTACSRAQICRPVPGLTRTPSAALIGGGGSGPAVAAAAWTPVVVSSAVTRAAVSRGRRLGTGKEWHLQARPATSPPDRQGHPLGVAGRALDPDDGTFVQLGEIARTGVGAGAAQPGDDRVDQVLHAWPLRIQVHPRT